MVDGQQVELPDNWLANGNVWEIAATEDTCQIQFGGHVEQYEENDRECYRTVGAYTIDAVPYDMPIVGYNNECVNTLRTWSARSQQRFDLRSFGDYRLAEHIVLENPDMKAVNTAEHSAVTPKLHTDRTEKDGNLYKANLTKTSWNVLRFVK